MAKKSASKAKRRRRTRPQDKRALPNPRQELFCQLFVFGQPKHDPNDPTSPGQTRHNATESYWQAGYKANRRSAGTLGSKMLKNLQILARIDELRGQEQTIRGAFLARWKTLLPEAQDVLCRAMAGEDVSAGAIRAAENVIEQAMGPSRFRFGIQQGTDKDEGVHITVWAGGPKP